MYKIASLRLIVLSLVFVLSSLAGYDAYSQVLTYTNDAGGLLSSVDANASGTALARVNGAATPGAPCGLGFSVSAFTNATVFSVALPAVEVSATPHTGFTLNITGFTADLRRSNSGPASIRYAYSTDGGATWIDQGTEQSPSNSTCGTTNTGTWTTPVFVSAPLQLKLRIYGFNATSASGALQLLNLAINGSVTASPACAIPPGLTATFTTTSSATLGWTAIPGALSYNVRYRQSGLSIWNTLSTTGTSTTLSSLSAGTTYECEIETVCSSGTSGFSPTTYFTTAPGGATSASSGKIAVYFNNPVDNAVSTGVNAVYLHDIMADTIIAYLDRAKYTVDIAIYSYNQSSGFSNIATAVNNCVARGVRVRWIYDASQANTGLALLNPAIPKLGSPTTSAYGIMHNKFFIIDANSTDPNDAIVSTGSTNWGISQLNHDYNNIIYIQDSALAHAYRDHFNMMWGDTGIAPNTTLSKFGPFKTDLGRHIFNISGKTVELYFSPSDHTDSHIQSAINSANSDLYFGVFTFTQGADASAIVARNGAGVYIAGIVDENSTLAGTAYGILTSGLGSLLKTHTGSVIYHNKMMMIDPSNACSDPLVLTGSHNWSSSADTKNDENIIIIHDDTLANIYYQSFRADYAALGGTLATIPPCAITTCGIPSGLFASSVTPNTAILNWSAVSGALSYTIQYRVVGSGTWNTSTSATNSLAITSLSPATAYEFQVEATCSSGSGGFSSSQNFTTPALSCSVPTGLVVFAVDTNLASLGWTTVSGAINYHIQYRTLGAATWNLTSSSTNATTLTSLTPANTYEFAIQVVCSSTDSSAYSITDTFTTDTVTIVPGCSAPTGLLIPSVDTTFALVSWTSVPGAAHYNIQYRTLGATIWTTATSATSSATISSLTPGTTYEFQVQAVCSTTDSSAFSSTDTFTTITTTPPPTACAIPGHALFPATGVADVSAVLNWTAVIGATKYNVRYRKQGTSMWMANTVIPSWLLVSGLTPSTTYEFQVQAICLTGTTLYTTSDIFTTSPRHINSVPTNNGNNATLAIFPNPTTGDFMVYYHLNTPQPVNITVYDLVGKPISVISANELHHAGDHTNTISIPTSGIHFVKWSIGDVNATERIIKL